MTRPLRVEFSGAFHHVYSRGNGKQKIFTDEADCQSFCQILEDVIRKRKWVCHAYCLEVTHFHLIIETPEGLLSKGMHDLNGAYSQAFNRKHNRVGHVMQGRYKSPVIEDDSHFLGVARYIVLNPVYDKLVVQPELWRWSSYAATAGSAPAPDFLEIDFTRRLFDDSTEKAIDMYRRFVVEGVDAERVPDHIADVIFGTEITHEEIKAQLEAARHETEYRRKDRYADSPPLSRLFEGARKGPVRNRRIVQAYRDFGYTMTQIAAFLGISCSTVSRALRAADPRDSAQ